MFGVGKFDQFRCLRRFSTMNATRTPSDRLFAGIRISRPASSEERSVTSKRDVRHSPDEIGNRRIRFEAHPFHATFAFLVTDDKEFQVLQMSLARLRFVSGDPNVVISAHCFLYGRTGAKRYLIPYPYYTPPSLPGAIGAVADSRQFLHSERPNR